MKGKKSLFAFVLCALIVAGPAFAGGGSEGASTGKANFPISTAIPPNAPVTIGLQNFSRDLNATGLFESSVFPSSQLGSINDMIERCIAGDALVQTGDCADVADATIKDLSVAQAPFLFKTWEQGDKFLASSVWKDLCDQVETKGIKILSTWAGGSRHILTKFPVTKLSDLAGKKIRVPNNNNFVRTFNAFGAAPTPLSLTEVFTAIQQGVIDGMENPYADIYSNKFHEVAKYMVEDDYLKQYTTIMVGVKYYNTLTPEQQKYLVDLCQLQERVERDIYLKADNEARENLAKEGVTFTKLNLDEFTQAIDKSYYPQMTDWTPGLVDKVRAIIAQ
ncbi:MAG: TRAP transporter substrate-binding protein DctP [Spirochaetales bacterium]|jgi:tripartite ATP-independent transporter DctP family solute receptor|nr:TRAP transporter substrate-binding protein DctP [Spirochaetales bacterium]